MVADPEAEAQHGLDLTHKTSGFVRYTNGAITPEDTASVKAAKIQHHTLKVGLDRANKFAGYRLPDRTKTGHNFFSTFKAALTDDLLKKTPVTYAVNPFHQVYQPQVYGLHHQQQFVRPSVYGLHRQHQIFADPRVYGLHHQRQFVAPQVFGLHQQHQQVLPGTGGPYIVPAVRSLGKREAEAEPEAEAEAEAQYYGSQYYGQYYGTPARTYPLARYPYSSAYTTGYPSTYTTAYTTGYPTTYNTALTGYPTTYNTALTGYPTTYNTALTGYPSIYNTALTGYPSVYNTAYTGYPNTFNTAYTGYPSIYKAALYNKAQVQAQRMAKDE